MTEVVVGVGPGTITGPNAATQEQISVALDCIDDSLALLDDRPVQVDTVWRDVMSTVAGCGVDTLVLVYPAWWPSTRMARVRAAAVTVAPRVEAVPRTMLLRGHCADPRAVVIEIADELIVVSPPDPATPVVVPRRDADTDAEAVAGAVGGASAAVVDAPDGVAGAARLGPTIADALGAVGITVTFVDADSMLRAALADRETERGAAVADRPPRMRFGRRGAAVLAGLLTSAFLVGGFALGDPAKRDAAPVTTLVEGRVAAVIPANWQVRRVTTGPGSARLQVSSPSEPDLALHITQSTGLSPVTLAAAAASLRRALAEEPDGVFVDFNPADRRVGRPAVTYREVRPEKTVVWAVLVEGPVRIAIGCQSPPGREHLVDEVCDQAIRSAHAAR